MKCCCGFPQVQRHFFVTLLKFFDVRNSFCYVRMTFPLNRFFRFRHCSYSYLSAIGALSESEASCSYTQSFDRMSTAARIPLKYVLIVAVREAHRLTQFDVRFSHVLPKSHGERKVSHMEGRAPASLRRSEEALQELSPTALDFLPILMMYTLSR